MVQDPAADRPGNGPVMIGVSGIRGIVGEGLTPDLVVAFAQAAGTFWGPGPVMVGRDSRTSGEMVKAAVFSGLAAVGCDPVDLGLCPTPTVQMAVEKHKAVGGIVVTASHNPKEWNALKLVGPSGLFLDEEEGKTVRRILEENRIRRVKWDSVGRFRSQENAVEEHIQAILGLPFLDIRAIRKRRFRVALDTVNGAGATILPQLLDELGCRVFGIHLEPTGLFAHTPEPLPENLGDLSRLVLEKRADIGLASDPDVDRLAMVAETGEPIGEEYTLTLAVWHILSRKKGPVVVNMSTTRAVDDVADAFGCEVFRTPVGEIHVAKKMKSVGAVIGGEGNGGVILPDLHLGRDAPMAAVLALQTLAESRGCFSDLWKSLPQYRMSKKKIEIRGRNPEEILAYITDAHRSDRLDFTDGVRIDGPDWWVHIRKSNTEPVIRVIAEAKTREQADRVCESMLQEVLRPS